MKNNIGNEFMRLTQYKFLDESDQAKGVPQPPIEIPENDNPLLDLDDPNEIEIPERNLSEILTKRKSYREYSDEPLTRKELSFLLWSTQGVKKRIIQETAAGFIDLTLRTVPSAGARHPLETFILLNNVEGFEPGLYRYIATKHKLQALEVTEDIQDEIVKACLGQEFLKTAAATFLWVADSYRTRWRYGERGIRYLFLDAGHVCQNLYLSATAIDAGACAVGAFNDEEINGLLGLDGTNLFVIYLATVGKLVSKA